ncbi:MAG: TetR/AcrR family transcriptional regulator [Planctomycetes bacterium]|nr:TetR/AcrR family transcriptional regulator [Planctomycetota bacterium]
MSRSPQPQRKAKRNARGRPPNPEMRQAKHARMLKEAMNLFVSHGYEQVTVELIARSAGQSKGAFYWYFKDKEECLYQIIQQQSELFAQTMKRAIDEGRNARERLYNVSDFRRWSDREFLTFLVMARSLVFSRSPTVRAMITEMRSAWFNQGVRTVVNLARDAAHESGWSDAAMAAFDFESWVLCYIACYEGIYAQLQGGLLKHPKGNEGIATAIHKCFVDPLTQSERRNMRASGGL